jgi:hypothetical protein
MRPTKIDHGASSFNAKPRLQRAGFVVKARVDHSAVVARLMKCYVLLFFKDDDPEARMLLKELQACRKTNDPGPNDRNITRSVIPYAHKLFSVPKNA